MGGSNGLTGFIRGFNPDLSDIWLFLCVRIKVPTYLDSDGLTEGVGPQYRLPVVWDTRTRKRLKYQSSLGLSEM